MNRFYVCYSRFSGRVNYSIRTFPGDVVLRTFDGPLAMGRAQATSAILNAALREDPQFSEQLLAS